MLQVYFLIGILVMAAITYYYTDKLTRRIRKETETASRMFASYAAGPKVDEEAIMNILFMEVIQKIDFPVVLTDNEGKPTFWKNVGEKDLTKVIARLDREYAPIPIAITSGGEIVVGQVHYGLSNFARTLRLLPWLETFFLLLFLSSGFWGYLMFKKNEEEKIWTSLAKETAHQLATPLSSLVGWIETMKGRLDAEIIEGVNEDARRMRAVLEKFSRIGQPPKLIETAPRPIIEAVIHYMQRRAHRGVTLSAQYETEARIFADEVLFGWAIENIVKNSLDAIGSTPGQVKVRLYEAGSQVAIELLDTGPGIAAQKEKDIFRAGYTTKKYGWGLGLVLAKRIIEEYHGGRLTLKESVPGRTMFVIFVPHSNENKGAAI